MGDQLLPRRRFQFRLRTLLIGVTLLAVACGYVAYEKAVVDRQRALLDWLKKQHGQIRTDGGLPIPVGIERPSFVHRLMGDVTVLEIILRSPFEEEDIQRLTEAFPGAKILDFNKRAKQPPATKP